VADVVELAIADLRFDEVNPRLGTPNEGQRETFRAMAAAQGAKLRALAEDIVRYGLDPSELPIVMSVEGAENAYVVLDANRRLTALRALENPDALVDSGVPSAALTALRQLSKQYQNAPIDTTRCLVVQDRDEARHWIELRHQGELGGAGRVQWGSDEIARWRARNSGTAEIHTQALDFLEARGLLAPEVRRQVAATTLKRLLSTDQLRKAVGVTWSGGELKAIGDADRVAAALQHVVLNIANGMKVNDVYYVADRVAYADKLPPSVKVKPTRNPSDAVALSALPRGSGGAAPTTPTTPPIARIPKQRDKLIPRDCIMQVTDPRIRNIEHELRGLSLESYPNAIAVLFRVFVELSADAYIGRLSTPAGNDPTLGTKLKDVTDHLVSHQKLTKAQAAPVRQAAQKGSFMGPSVTTMNQWVHNAHMFPGPSDLRAGWDNLQPWCVAVWS
jgi:hypothetical protein